MKGKIIFPALLCLLGIGAYCQHDNNWYFGQWAGITFSSGSPVAITDSNFWIIEGPSAISDENGQLLFYTNGVKVTNRNKVTMLNGEGLKGGSSSTQSSIIIPAPGNAGRYYVFTTDDAGGPDGLMYSEVNMNGDNGLGTVEVKNIPLVAPVTEKITATLHENGTDVWVIVHHWGSNAFYAYLVNAQGVNPTPVISNTGLVAAGASNSGKYAGCMTVSPNGKHIAAAHTNTGVELLDFDTATGQVSNAVLLSGNAGNSPVEFSPDSNLLYAIIGENLVQYQVNLPDVPASQFIITAQDRNHMALGPDGKIYVLGKFLSEFISVIDNPNAIGAGCNFLPGSVSLGGKKSYMGLPHFLKVPFYMLDIKADEDCSGTAIHFTASGTMEPDTTLWDFGDGNTAAGLSVTHTYVAAGTYTVRIKSKRGVYTRYYSRQVVIHESPVALKPQDMIACSDSGVSSFNLRSQAPAILGPAQAVDFMVSFYANEADAHANANALPDIYANVSNPQVVYARVSPDAGDCHAVTSFALRVVQNPEIDMPDTFYFCEGGDAILEGPDGFDEYIWERGQDRVHTRRIATGIPGIYKLTVIKRYGNVLCASEKEVTVSLSAKPEIAGLDIADWTNSNAILVRIDAPGNYEYSLNGSIWQDSPVFEGLVPGKYTVYVSNSCGTDSATAVLLMYPKFFTPNGDGENETWRIPYAHWEPEIVVQIFDRYGKLIHSDNGSGPGWNGSFNGTNLPSTDYWFVVERKDGRKHKGHFSMLR